MKNLNVILICYKFSGKINYLTIQDVLTKKLIFKNLTNNNLETPSQIRYNQFLELLTHLHSLFNSDIKNYEIKNNALLCIDLEKCYDNSFEITGSTIYVLKDYFFLSTKWEDVCQEMIDNEFIEFLGAGQFRSVPLKTLHSKNNSLIISTLKK